MVVVVVVAVVVMVVVAAASAMVVVVLVGLPCLCADECRMPIPARRHLSHAAFNFCIRRIVY